jgi:hypothetical protein
MKEIQLGEVKVGQGFYEKETGFFFNRVSLRVNLLDSYGGDHVPVLNGRWEIVTKLAVTPVLVEG